MKKFLCILLSLLITTPMLLIGASAESSEITFEEAERLSFEAVRRYLNIATWDGYREVDVNIYKGYFLFQSQTGEFFNSPYETISSDKAFSLNYKGVDWDYRKVEKLAAPFINVEDLDNYIKEIYGGKALDTFFAENNYVEKDGNIYVPYSGGEGWYGRSHRLLLCNNFVSNGDGKAVMNVVFGVYGGPAADLADFRGISALNTSYAKQRELLRPVNATVEFAKTENGWRVTGGSLLEMISDPTTIPNDWDYKPYLGDTPFTGDSTPIIITLLTLSGIVLACVPAVKRRRR